MSLTFSIRLNNDLAVRELIRIAKTAEDHGFDQIWVSKRPVPALRTHHSRRDCPAHQGDQDRVRDPEPVFDPSL